KNNLKFSMGVPGNVGSGVLRLDPTVAVERSEIPPLRKPPAAVLWRGQRLQGEMGAGIGRNCHYFSSFQSLFYEGDVGNLVFPSYPGLNEAVLSYITPNLYSYEEENVFAFTLVAFLPFGVGMGAWVPVRNGR
ncbi:MAG: hypothetical protein JJT75_02690, partial [Opitutales bacterium]|nr:hypothetical protein [Opitutales bacterium]